MLPTVLRINKEDINKDNTSIFYSIFKSLIFLLNPSQSKIYTIF